MSACLHLAGCNRWAGFAWLVFHLFVYLSLLYGTVRYGDGDTLFPSLVGLFPLGIYTQTHGPVALLFTQPGLVWVVTHA